ncbi:hypothetical protein N7523_010806 [Penicillium sp. IBT 18751x]|nr:hypothetical protein N7523_010806 [Penicillium sp. IBT 18751x]
MSSFSEQQQPSSSQLVPPESAQPYRSLFGGPSSDLSLPPSSLPEPARKSIFGGPAQDVATEPETEAEFLDRGLSNDEEDELGMIMRGRPLAVDYDSDGDSFQDSDEEAKFAKRPKSGVKNESRAPQPISYVLDRGLDLPPGVDRPNRWTGNSTTYRKLISDALASYEGLTTAQSRDLAAHLYNSYMVRLESKDNTQGVVEEGDEKTTISKRWGAWPLPPSRVPRPDDHMKEWLNDPDTIRMPPDPRPSAELEESIIAVMMRISKENFLDRDWDFDGIKTNKSKRSIDPDAMMDKEDEKDEDDQKDLGPYADPSFLQPALQTDDDVARRQLRPLARNVITQVDRLLTALQRTMDYRIDERPNRSRPQPRLDDNATEFKFGEGTSSKRESRGRKRSHNERSSPGKSEGAGTRETSQSRDQSRESRASANEVNEVHEPSEEEEDDCSDDGIPFNAKLPLRDWSEVMGLASMIGLPRDAVMRASKRCADLFNQDMTFRTFREGRIAPAGRKEDKSIYYDYHESQSEDSETDPPERKRKKVSRNESKSHSRRNKSNSREAGSMPVETPVNPHTIVPGFAPSLGTTPERSSPERSTSRRPKGKGEHRKADLVCPIKSCPRHLDGFSRTWNLNLHMKRVHPGYQERERSTSRSQSRQTEEPEVIVID